jgi:hypothetical protein
MKRIIFSGVLSLLMLAAFQSDAQRTCGTSIHNKELRQRNPDAYQQTVVQRLKEAEAAQRNAGTASKTSAANPIPVVFHVLLSAAKYANIGGDAGLKRRIATQLAVLNDDYNQRNADLNVVPAAFKGLVGNLGIQFGLATKTNGSTIAPGIEVKILTTSPSYNVYNGYRAAKENTAVGLEAWDASKYLNIWVLDVPNEVLGLCIPPSEYNEQWGDRQITETDFGVTLHYLVLGVKESSSQTFKDPYNKGRTLTHEIGHYFNLRHIWGDDDDVNSDGYCEGEKGGSGDGIGDTPDQSRSTFCDFPNHRGSNCPTFPLLDKCSPASPGVMFMNFMDYVDDAAMQMFTKGQAAVVRAELATGGRSYSLTQQPGLATLGVSKVSEIAFNIFPNPAVNGVHVSLGGSEKLQSIQLINLTGQLVREIRADGRREYELQTGDVPRGMYFVQCRFDEGMLSRKIVLQ